MQVLADLVPPRGHGIHRQTYRSHEEDQAQDTYDGRAGQGTTALAHARPPTDAGHWPDATAGRGLSPQRRVFGTGRINTWPWYGVLVDNDDERNLPGPGRSYSRGRRRVGILVVTYNAESTLAATLDRSPIDFRP